MMKRFSEILALFVLVLMSSACNPFDVEEVLLSREDISLMDPIWGRENPSLF